MGKKNKRSALSKNDQDIDDKMSTLTSSTQQQEENVPSKKMKTEKTHVEMKEKNADKSNKEKLSNTSSKNAVSSSNPKETKLFKPTEKGIDAIDELFAMKKETEHSNKKQEEENEKKREEQRAFFRKNNNDSTSASSLFIKNAKTIQLEQDRSDVQKIQRGEWANDGLGGVFDNDGYTGRKQDGTGYKIYKAHLFNKKGFGTTPDCPFDCDCCYI